MLRALVLALALALLTATGAEAQSRPRIIFDVPPDRVIQIGRVARGFSIEVDVPFHATGDIQRAEVTVWSRGVIAGLVGPRPIGAVSAFTPRNVVVRLTATPRLPLGAYPMSVMIVDRETGARDIFRTHLLVEESSQPAPVAPAPVATPTPRPSPTPRPTATATPRPVLGWGRHRPLVRPTSPPRNVPRVAERASGRGMGFVRP